MFICAILVAVGSEPSASGVVSYETFSDYVVILKESPLHF